jgi:hypothetical protein
MRDMLQAGLVSGAVVLAIAIFTLVLILAI